MSTSPAAPATRSRGATTADPDERIVSAFTDGACLGNPGPGGFGVVLTYRGHRKELARGYRRSTNNRMELMACIAALRELSRPCVVTITSDSSYVVKGMTAGWVERWRRNGWMRDRRHPVKNADLWRELSELCERHRVRFTWVRGHAGHPENERADELAGRAASQDASAVDHGFEAEAGG